MASSAARLPDSVARYLAIAPSVFSAPSGPSPASMRVGGLLDERACGLEPGDVGDDQLVRVALLLRQGRAARDARLGVLDGTVDGLPAAAEAERRHHHAGVAEDLLGLHEALALDPADEVLDRDLDVVQEQGGRVRQPDPVLVLGLGAGEALGSLVHDEPCRAAGGQREDRGGVGDGAVGDPLLRAADAVAGDLAVDLDRDGLGLHRAQVGPGLGLGGAVGEDDPVLGDRAEPLLLLLLGGADQDRVAAQERGEDRGGQADVLAGHDLAEQVGVEGPTAHASVRLGDEDQLDAQVGRHRTHRVLGADVLVVELQLAIERQCVLEVLLQAVQHQAECFGVQPLVSVHSFPPTRAPAQARCAVGPDGRSK